MLKIPKIFKCFLCCLFVLAFGAGQLFAGGTRAEFKANTLFIVENHGLTENTTSVLGGAFNVGLGKKYTSIKLGNLGITQTEFANANTAESVVASKLGGITLPVFTGQLQTVCKNDDRINRVWYEWYYWFKDKSDGKKKAVHFTITASANQTRVNGVKVVGTNPTVLYYIYYPVHPEEGLPDGWRYPEAGHLIEHVMDATTMKDIEPVKDIYVGDAYAPPLCLHFSSHDFDHHIVHHHDHHYPHHFLNQLSFHHLYYMFHHHFHHHYHSTGHSTGHDTEQNTFQNISQNCTLDPEAGLKKLISEKIKPEMKNKNAVYAFVDYYDRISPKYDCDSQGNCTADVVVSVNKREASVDIDNVQYISYYYILRGWNYYTRDDCKHTKIDGFNFPRRDYQISPQDKAVRTVIGWLDQCTKDKGWDEGSYAAGVVFVHNGVIPSPNPCTDLNKKIKSGTLHDEGTIGVALEETCTRYFVDNDGSINPIDSVTTDIGTKNVSYSYTVQLPSNRLTLNQLKHLIVDPFRGRTIYDYRHDNVNHLACSKYSYEGRTCYVAPLNVNKAGGGSSERCVYAGKKVVYGSIAEYNDPDIVQKCTRWVNEVTCYKSCTKYRCCGGGYCWDQQYSDWWDPCTCIAYSYNCEYYYYDYYDYDDYYRIWRFISIPASTIENGCKNSWRSNWRGQQFCNLRGNFCIEKDPDFDCWGSVTCLYKFNKPAYHCSLDNQDYLSLASCRQWCGGNISSSGSCTLYP